MTRRRHRLSPEHRAALRAGYERWRRGELPHGIPSEEEPPRRSTDGLARYRARQTEIRAARLANLALAREARRQRNQPLPEPTVDSPPPPPASRTSRARARRSAAREEALQRARAARQLRLADYRRPYEERARELMDRELASLKERVFSILSPGQTVETSYQAPVLADRTAELMTLPGGYERIIAAQNEMYTMMADALSEIVQRLEAINAAEGTHYVLFAKRGNSYRWNKVSAYFIHSMREVTPATETVPYSHLVDWRLNGSNTELQRETLMAAPFPASISFQIMDVAPPTRPTRPPRNGSWAPWRNSFRALDLTKFQIDFTDHAGLTDDEEREHCFIFALRLSGKVDRATLDLIASELYARVTTMCSLKDICQRYQLPVRVTCYTRGSHYVYLGPRSRRCIEIGLYDHHYFYDGVINVSNWVLEHPGEASNQGLHPRLGWAYVVDDGRVIQDPHPIRRAGSVIKRMKELGLLTPIRGDDPRAIKKNYYAPKTFDDSVLEYQERYCTPFKAPAVCDRLKALWFADFETTTNGDQHLPYMLCACSADGVEYETHDYATTTDNVEEIWSNKLAAFVTFVLTHSPTDHEPLIYFHNLNYDMAFIIPYIPIQDKFKVTEVNNRVIGFRVFNAHLQRSVTFRDSYTMISAPLRSFGKMFALNIEKEIYPYEYYTTTNFQSHLDESGAPYPPVDQYLSHYKDPDELLTKVTSLELMSDGKVDAHAYARYYCMLDCKVLRDGFLEFRKQLLEVTSLDCVDFITLPSIAYNYLIKDGVFDGCFNIAGPPLFFIRRCLLGGRCMLRNNQKQDITGNIADFDAVSLYPSAMARLYTLRGLPKVITGQMHCLANLLETDGFFAEVHINRVGRVLDFPLLARPNAAGIMTYGNEPGTYFTDDISLRLIMWAHDVAPEDITVLRGYYYNDGKNFRIRDTITHLFNERKRLKQEGNPLEQAYKLLMNSCYGKSIMKPIVEENVVAVDEEFRRILLTKGGEALSYRRAGSRYILKMGKNIVSAKGFPAFGVHILAMSKVIMSELMVPAQLAHLLIYYTDTDSIHIDSDSIERLATIYRELYGRELIGSDMGQFHTDFPPHPVTKNPTWSRRFIGVGKKAYIDELFDPQTGQTAYHMRLKGIPNNVITAAANDQFDGNVIALYEHLYAGKPVTFNLLSDRVSFAINENFAYVTRTEFTRTTCFK